MDTAAWIVLVLSIVYAFAGNLETLDAGSIGSPYAVTGDDSSIFVAHFQGISKVPSSGAPTVIQQFPSTGVFTKEEWVYFSDGSSVKSIKKDGSTFPIFFAGTGLTGFGGDGGVATSANLAQPFGIHGNDDNLYIADSGNHCIRRVSWSTGLIATVAGTPRVGGYLDNVMSTIARLMFPRGVHVHEQRLYIADSYNNRIRVMDLATGTITTLAGTGIRGFNGNGMPATSAAFTMPWSTYLLNNKLFIADTGNNRVRAVDLTSGTVEPVVGSGVRGYNGDGIPATSAALANPMSLYFQGNTLYIADFGNSRVRKMAYP